MIGKDSSKIIITGKEVGKLMLQKNSVSYSNTMMHYSSMLLDISNSKFTLSKHEGKYEILHYAPSSLVK